MSIVIPEEFAVYVVFGSDDTFTDYFTAMDRFIQMRSRTDLKDFRKFKSDKEGSLRWARNLLQKYSFAYILRSIDFNAKDTIVWYRTMRESIGPNWNARSEKYQMQYSMEVFKLTDEYKAKQRVEWDPRASADFNSDIFKLLERIENEYFYYNGCYCCRV